ncbi:hypothetical protein ACI797_19415 [Geodermatophilus sp. SYSU D00691]
MAGRRLLVALSTAQLAVQLLGAGVAVRRAVTYDIPFLHGRPDRVRRDALWLGSAFSAPTPMIAAQAWATARLLVGPDDAAPRVLVLLGVAMLPGILLERRDRERLTPAGFDPVETPLVAGALGLTAAMVLAGRQVR